MKEPKGKTGDMFYEVAWCTEIPIDEIGDADFYSATFEAEYFKTREEAVAFAKEIFPKDVIGEVKIRTGYLELADPDYPIIGHVFEPTEDEAECIYEGDL